MLILIYICSNHRGWLDKTSSSKQFLVIWEGNSQVNLARELLLLTQYFHQPYRIIIHRLPPPPPLTSLIVCTEGYWLNQPEHVAWTDYEYYCSTLDGMPLHCRVTPKNLIRPSWQSARTHLYSWVEKGTVNATQWPKPGLRPRPLDRESCILTIRPLHPFSHNYNKI